MDFLAQTLRIAIPYVFASVGGAISEKSGMIALGLEGYMLTGAFCAALGSFYTGSAWGGLIAGLLGGALVALLYAFVCIRYKADQVVVGIAINLFVIALTRVLLKLAFASTANSPRVQGFGAEQSGVGFAALATNPLFWLALFTAVGAGWAMTHTPFGLRVRAVGEHPGAALSAGIRASRVQYYAVALSGALAGLGGTYLALDQHQFSAEMTAGRGFIALAATILGRWDPKRAAIACLLFSAADALQIRLQGSQMLPVQFVEIIPYVLTIVALAGFVGRAVPPAALGRAAE